MKRRTNQRPSRAGSMRAGLLASCSAIVLASSFALAGCGGRDNTWDRAPSTPSGVSLAFGLKSSVAVLDDAEQRAMMLTVAGNQRLSAAYRAIGKNVLHAEIAPDRSRLFVLSGGVTPRRTSQDEAPSLTVIDDGGDMAVRRYPLSERLSGLAIDPLGKWAVIYAGTSGDTGGAFVENPNELLIVDLERGAGTEVDKNPRPYTLRSFGGRPERITFTGALDIAHATRRLLLVETDQDLSIVDLSHLDEDNITVRFTNGTDARQLTPAGVAVADRDAVTGADPQIGVRFSNDTNVMTLSLSPPDADTVTTKDFTAKTNLTDVGGTPGDIAYVKMQAGLRLAALVPTRDRAVLVDPATSIVSTVDLPVAYSSLSLVTNEVGGPADGEVALLWGSQGAGSGVAFWALGTTPDKPYRSVETLPSTGAVSDAIDVPGTKLKVLRGAGNGGQSAFFVLDLEGRTAARLEVSRPNQNVNLSIALGGHEVLALAPDSTDFSVVSLDDLHPTQLLMDRPAVFVFDVTRTDGGGTALVAIHKAGDVGATVFDDATLDSGSARLYSGLLLGGLSEGTAQ